MNASIRRLKAATHSGNPKEAKEALEKMEGRYTEAKQVLRVQKHLLRLGDQVAEDEDALLAILCRPEFSLITYKQWFWPNDNALHAALAARKATVHGNTTSVGPLDRLFAYRRLLEKLPCAGSSLALRLLRLPSWARFATTALQEAPHEPLRQPLCEVLEAITETLAWEHPWSVLGEGAEVEQEYSTYVIASCKEWIQDHALHVFAHVSKIAAGLGERVPFQEVWRQLLLLHLAQKSASEITHENQEGVWYLSRDPGAHRAVMSLLLLQCNAHVRPDVKACLESVYRCLSTAHEVQHTYPATRPLQDSFPFSLMMKALEILLHSHDLSVLVRTLAFVYRIADTCSSPQRRHLFQLLLGHRFVPLFLHWHPGVRRHLFHLLVFRLVRPQSNPMPTQKTIVPDSAWFAPRVGHSDGNMTGSSDTFVMETMVPVQTGANDWVPVAGVGSEGVSLDTELQIQLNRQLDRLRSGMAPDRLMVYLPAALTEYNALGLRRRPHPCTVPQLEEFPLR